MFLDYLLQQNHFLWNEYVTVFNLLIYVLNVLRLFGVVFLLSLTNFYYKEVINHYKREFMDHNKNNKELAKTVISV